MLSDSIFDILQALEKTIKDYDYSDDYKNEILNVYTELRWIQYNLDGWVKRYTKEDTRRFAQRRYKYAQRKRARRD